MICNLLNNNIYSKDKNKQYILEKSIITWNRIPIEILDKIFDFIPTFYKINLCKKYYSQYHIILKTYITSNNYESYIHSMICDNNSFVFERILNENLSKWLHWKNYRVKSIVYKSYLYYIYNLIETNNSDKCRIIFIKYLEEYLKKNNIDIEKSSFKLKNWFKNNNIKNVKIQ